MKRPKIASEAALAEVVSGWLRADGWRTFHEVELPRGGRADIVAHRRGLLWIVETKLQASLDVLDQALDRRRAGAHGVVVAVPGGPAALRLAGICGRLGIGVIAVDEVEDFDGRAIVSRLRPELKAWPDFARKAKPAEILRWCTPGHEHQAPGVTGAAVRWTPFKAAMRGVVYALAEKPGHTILLAELALHEAVREYKPRFVAPQLRRWLSWAISDRLVPGCSFVKVGGKRAVWLDVAAVTAKQVREFQLDEFRVKLEAAAVVAGA